MSLNSAYLDAFFACARLKSFTQAASRLHITQSALSQRIKNLEDDLGTTLIIRERSGLRLTETGEEILRYCQTKEGLEAELAARIKSPRAGKGSEPLGGAIRIGTFSSVARSVVVPALAPLLRKHPDVQLKLVVAELHELPKLLKSGEVDYVTVQDEIAQEGLATIALGAERNALVRKRGYEGPETYLDHDEEDTITARYLRRKSPAGLRRRYLGDAYGILDGARAGLGLAVVPMHLAARCTELEIIHPERVLRMPVLLQHYELPFYSRLHHAVVETLGRECPRLLDEDEG
jgi:DNA-binding transcriptional LysR family regulator